MRAFAFKLRSSLRWRRGRPALRHEPKARLFDYLTDQDQRAAAIARERVLVDRYDLAPLHARSTSLVYRDNLALLDGLERLFGHRRLDLPPRTLAVDVGAQDWRYVFALERFLRLRDTSWPRSVELTGVEVDGHVVYPSLHARCDRARAYAAQTGNPAVRYVVADFRDYPAEDLDLVSMLFPFVLPGALRAWGLPETLYDPFGLYERAARALRPGGRLVAFHQTEAEARAGAALCGRVGLRVESTVGIATALVHDHLTTRGRVAILARRP